MTAPKGRNKENKAMERKLAAELCAASVFIMDTLAAGIAPPGESLPAREDLRETVYQANTQARLALNAYNRAVEGRIALDVVVIQAAERLEKGASVAMRMEFNTTLWVHTYEQLKESAYFLISQFQFTEDELTSARDKLSRFYSQP
jgi:hypothetical protein